MKPKYIFNPKIENPNISEGLTFKDNAYDNEHVLEIDIKKVSKDLGLDKKEAIEIAKTVVHAIWRMKIYKTQ